MEISFQRISESHFASKVQPAKLATDPNKHKRESVPIPHTQGKDISGGVRPATPDEIPKQKPE